MSRRRFAQHLLLYAGLHARNLTERALLADGRFRAYRTRRA